MKSGNTGTAEPFSGKADELIAAAIKATGGLDDFGDEQSFLPGLKQLLLALDVDKPSFTKQGYQFAYQMLVGNLVSRLLTQEGWKLRPDCLNNQITKPLVILGIPRTGTTALHKLLSVDTQFQGLECWLTQFPMPRPPLEDWPASTWYQASVAGLDAMFALVPEIRKAHDIKADDVDECLNILKQDFCSNMFGSSLPVPSYDDWWSEQSEAPSYRRYVKVMQLIGANSPDKKWLLKNPGHLANVDLLLEIFPDACIVQTHRNPVKAIPSVCSTIRYGRMLIEGENVRPDVLGKRELNYWSKAVCHADEIRKRAPQQFFDVTQADFNRDPLAVVESIYDYFGLELTSDTIELMQRRIGLNPERSHGLHSYSIEQFGIEEADIRDRFSAYIARYLSGQTS